MTFTLKKSGHFHLFISRGVGVGFFVVVYYNPICFLQISIPVLILIHSYVISVETRFSPLNSLVSLFHRVSLRLNIYNYQEPKSKF